MNLTRRRMLAHLGLTGGALLGSRLLSPRFGAGPEIALADDATRPSANPSTQTRWEISAKRKAAKAKEIVWLTHEPMEFLLRRGDHFNDEPEHYQRMLDPDNLKRMADIGVQWGILFFYKGFGLEYEHHNMDLSKRAADTMHQLGMKVSLYFAGTMFTETLYRELPEAQGWEQRDQNNEWIPYGLQTYRRYACPNEPAYREYLKKILAIGVNEIHADEIAFDNIMLQPEPKSCRCFRCQKAFADFLRDRYPTKEVALRRFGLPDVDWIHVNEWASDADPQSLKTLDDPVLQEWVGFRCRSLANHANALYEIVKSMNPDVAANFNIKGVYSFNRYWTNAVYHPMYAGKIDGLSFDTSGYDEHIDADTGALISQVRSYKMARQINSSVQDSMKDELRAATHMAFGNQKPVKGAAGAPFGSGAHNVFNPLMEFFREYNQRYYTQTQNVADVAILRNWPTMAFSINATYVPATLMEQVLIQYKIPFDLLFDEQLDGLDRYAAVILAGQECVSDSQAALLLQYAQNGGTLLIASNTGVYNDWREKRHTDAFAAPADPNKPTNYDNDGWKPEQLINQIKPQRPEGKGRVVYIPEIIPAVEMSKPVPAEGDSEPGQPRLNPPQWVLPKNHKEIYQTIVGSLLNGFSITTQLPLITIAELVTRPTTRETIAHFVNFDRDKPLPPFPVTIRKQFSGPVQSVACLSPATDDPVPLPFQESADSITFTAPGMQIYSMIVVAQ
jgi:hypothetical protein